MEQINGQRRQFLKMSSTALAVGSIVMLTLKSPKSFAATGQVKSTISSNHGHAFGMSLSELKADGAQTYSIQGSSSHPHEIVITDDVIMALEKGHPVELESVGGNHTHTVTLELV